MQSYIDIYAPQFSRLSREEELLGEILYSLWREAFWPRMKEKINVSWSEAAGVWRSLQNVFIPLIITPHNCRITHEGITVALGFDATQLREKFFVPLDEGNHPASPWIEDILKNSWDLPSCDVFSLPEGQQSFLIQESSANQEFSKILSLPAQDNFIDFCAEVLSLFINTHATPLSGSHDQMQVKQKMLMHFLNIDNWAPQQMQDVVQKCNAILNKNPRPEDDKNVLTNVLSGSVISEAAATSRPYILHQLGGLKTGDLHNPHVQKWIKTCLRYPNKAHAATTMRSALQLLRQNQKRHTIRK